MEIKSFSGGTGLGPCYSVILVSSSEYSYLCPTRWSPFPLCLRHWGAFDARAPSTVNHLCVCAASGACRGDNLCTEVYHVPIKNGGSLSRLHPIGSQWSVQGEARRKRCSWE